MSLFPCISNHTIEYTGNERHLDTVAPDLNPDTPSTVIDVESDVEGQEGDSLLMSNQTLPEQVDALGNCLTLARLLKKLRKFKV